MTKDEALKLALEALKHTHPSALTSFYTIGDRDKAIKAIQEHLAQPETEYLAFMDTPQRTWVGLTDEEIVLIVAECAASHQHTDIHFARAIEAKLRSKNENR